MSASQRIPLSTLVQYPHKGIAPEISDEIGRRQERQGSRAVNGRKELAAVREKWRSDKGGYWGRSWNQWAQKPGQPTRESESAFLVAVWKFRSEYPLAIVTDAQKTTEKCPNFFLLALGANPSPCLFVLLFSHPIGCICCVLSVCKEMWIAPGRRWEKPLDDRMAMSWFKEVEIVGVGQRAYCHMMKLLYLTHRWDPDDYYNPGS